jgi:hypothetical protein
MVPFEPCPGLGTMARQNSLPILRLNASDWGLVEAYLALLFRDIAGFSLSNQTVCIVFEKVPATHKSFGGGAHLRDVLFVGPIALFERRPRVTGGEPLGLRFGEGNQGAGISADVAFVETASVGVPARVRP